MPIKVGDVFTTRSCGDCVVVEYVSARRIKVRFLDETQHEKWVVDDALKQGWVKNPYKPLLFGVGYFGEGKYKSRIGSASKGGKRVRSYLQWTNMLSRCYDKNYISTEVYTDVFVSPEWHNYQTFAEWYDNQSKYIVSGENIRFELDKDLMALDFNNREYSPETCCLLPNDINTKITNKFKPNADLLYGIRRVKAGFAPRSDFAIRNLRFDTQEECSQAVKNFKVQEIRNLANKYKDNLRPDVYKLLTTADFDRIFRNKNS